MTVKSLCRAPLACALWFVLPAAAAAQSDMPSPQATPSSTATAADRSKAKDLPRLVVEADATTGYRARTAESTARVAVPIKDIAASIQVVPQEVLRDRGVTRTDQLLDTVSGVLAESTYGGNGATFFNIRGFSENNGLRDGFRDYGYLAFRDVQNIERVEVFKGPAGALYGGVGAVGGYVNTVSKRPQSADFGEVGTTVGSYGLSRTTVDLNRSLSDGFSVRLNGAYDQGGSFRDDVDHHSWSLAPAVRWADADTSVTLLTEFNHLNRNNFDFGIPNVPNYRELSRSRYFGPNGANDSGVRNDFAKNITDAASLMFDHALNDDWTVRAAAHYAYAHQVSQQSFPNLDSYAGGDYLDYSVYSGGNEASREYTAQGELEGRFATGALAHTLLLGVDYGYLEQGGAGSPVSTLTLSLFDPRYTALAVPTDSAGPYHQAQGRDWGVYAQDLVELSPTVKLQFGLRGDRFINREVLGGVEVARGTQDAWSPRVGVVWEPDTATSIFADWSRSHAPNVAHGVSTSTYDAELGKQVEVGMKRDLIEDRLSGSIAWFHLTRANILTTDPVDPMKQVLTGRQASHGVEIDVAGALTPAWKVIAAYTYTRASVESDTTLPVGDTLANVPRHHASLWTTYAMQSAALQGLTIGSGLHYVGKRDANLPNSYTLASYVRTDASLAYERGPWRTQLNVLNVFDRHYYAGGSAGVFNYTLDPSRPRTAQLTVSYRL